MENETKEVIEISKERYEHLLKLERYVYHWCNPYRVCPKCDNYVMDGWCCDKCGYGF